MELLKIILGPEDSNQLLAFTLFTLIGMVFIKIWRFNIKLKKSLEFPEELHLKFNLRYWFKANSLDFILAFLVSFFIFRLFPDALNFLSEKFNVPEFVDKMTYGLVLGLFFQYFSHKFNNLLEKMSKKNEKQIL